ncbi:hypothetical protein Poly21_27130 [Allorhodopirellula heiligendammensis]|uniref:Uncharacterized protein n=1 Tax=Allorhodopirellula heiligendammensis TaxID=2714739 RepID=A0A5C6BWA2_9BACT|nr:hypothetical protein Poly21_27130 [Allorhodopirellula heiligendammensis]
MRLGDICCSRIEFERTLAADPLQSPRALELTGYTDTITSVPAASGCCKVKMQKSVLDAGGKS